MQRRTEESRTAVIASLLADPTRSVVLWTLSDGRALPAGELARLARVSPATMSEHLSKLVRASLIRVERSGRHRYYRIGAPAVVRVLEALATVAPIAPRSDRGITEDASRSAIRLARTCYDHLAGYAGVKITDALLEAGYMVETGSGYDVTAAGEQWFAALGIGVSDARRRANEKRRQFARACLDWSERRHHIAGELGERLCERLLELAWFERRHGTRALRVTALGRRSLKRHLGVTLL